MGPPPLNLEHMTSSSAEVPAQVVAYLAHSYEPFNTLLVCPVLGRGSCCPSVALLCMGQGSSPPCSTQGQAHSGTRGTLLMSTPGPTEESRAVSPSYILFLILPFLEGAPRPKAPCCSSCARRRLRAESCFRPPRCRKRIFWARRRCFRICCLVLSSESTRPVGVPGVRGWDAPAGTEMPGAQLSGRLPLSSPPRNSPVPTPILCSSPSIWQVVTAE